MIIITSKAVIMHTPLPMHFRGADFAAGKPPQSKLAFEEIKGS
jgi:hypothetical protein